MKSRSRAAVILVLACLLLASPRQVAAGSVASILETLMRAGRKAEHAAADGKILKHVDDIPVPRVAAYGDAELLRRFERLDNVDDGLRTQFHELPIGQRALVVELGEASQRVLRNHASPEDLLRMLDADGLMQARTYGDFVAEGVELMGPAYKDVVRKTGRGAASFSSNYLRPHYKELAAGGLVAAYLAAPEQFHDAAGVLTERAVRELTRLGIEVAGAANRGLWDGIRSKLIESPISSGLGIAFIASCLALALPRVRWHVSRAIRPLFTTPASDPQVAKGVAPPPRRFEE
jgi:hypothetical protein